MRTSPAAGIGSGISPTVNTSRAGPCFSYHAALMQASFLYVVAEPRFRKNQTSNGKLREERCRHLRGEFLEHADGARNVTVPHMHHPEVKNSEMPLWHHLDKPSATQQFRLNQRWKIPNPRARKQRCCKPGVVIHRKMRMKRQV